MEELDAGAKYLLVRVEELRNSLQPIQQLPPDVIVEIATYLNPRACGGDCQMILAMTQVCRYWRETLISNPESWCFISSEYMDLVPLFFERSGSYPLEVDLTDTWFFYAIRHLGPHAKKLEVLRCNIEEANTMFLQTLSQLDHSPNLHTLSINTIRAPTVPPQVAEMALISGNMPNLHTLELLPFPITPQFAQLKHLTNLRLDVVYCTLTDVLDLLAANPSLEKVRLLGNFEDSEDSRAIGSVSLEHLRFLTVERCTPCTFLEKLTLPHNARIFIRYNLISHLIPFAFTLPQSMGNYTNLQGLTSIYMLMGLNDTYLDATGPNGSVAIRFMDLQDPFPVCNAIGSLPTTGITQLVCEFHPAATRMEIDKITQMMNILSHLEEIVLIHFSSVDIQEFLSVLKNTRGWMRLVRLKFVHCRQVTNWIGDLIQVAAERMDESLGLNTVTVVYEGKEWVQELVDVLGGFVGTLELVEEEAEEVMRSEQVWDDTSCTARVVSVPAYYG